MPETSFAPSMQFEEASMAAAYKFSSSSQTYSEAGLAFVLPVIIAGLRRIARAFRNRRDAGKLAILDDRMLADIGITRSDLRDAYAEPLWRDPTDILAGRARERRIRRTDRPARHHL
jgi:uncharacterized protein YjiS (DUF1127 family)